MPLGYIIAVDRARSKTKVRIFRATLNRSADSLDTLRKVLPVPVKNALRPTYSRLVSILRFVIRLPVSIVRAALGRKLYLRLSHVLKREGDTTLEVAGIKFDAADYIPFHRAKTFLTKEPDTIAWIDDCFVEEDVFYDIGANVGVFSLYAVKNKNASVVAFEPFAANYSLLNMNIYLNDFSDQIIALNMAAHEKTVLARLNVSEFWAGKAGHSFGDPVGSRGDIFRPKFLQGVIGMAIDDFIESFDVPFPNHIKIDVDGNEPLVIAGMKKTMKDPRLKSVAVEINNDLGDHVVALKTIVGQGFRILSDEKYINRAYLAASTTQNYFLVRQ